VAREHLKISPEGSKKNGVTGGNFTNSNTMTENNGPSPSQRIQAICLISAVSVIAALLASLLTINGSAVISEQFTGPFQSFALGKVAASVAVSVVGISLAFLGVLVLTVYILSGTKVGDQELFLTTGSFAGFTGALIGVAIVASGTYRGVVVPFVDADEITMMSLMLATIAVVVPGIVSYQLSERRKQKKLARSDTVDISSRVEDWNESRIRTQTNSGGGENRNGNTSQPSHQEQPHTEPTPTSKQTQESEQGSNHQSPKGEQNHSDNPSLGELEFPWETNTGVSFNDVGGMDQLKEELTNDVVIPLTSGRQKAEEFDIPIPNILFYGPPGTGKTFMAEALATEIGFPFVKLSGSDVTSKWVNESTEQVGTLFDEAIDISQHAGGAIIFLDELDSVLKTRDGRSHEEDKKVVNEFLNKLGDLEDEDVLFIGATNRYGDLDEAGIRSGRIDKEVHIGKPHKETRKKILQKQLESRPNSVSPGSIEELAERTSGLVASDLKSLVVDAARKSAFNRKGEKITCEDLKAAIEEANPDS